MRLFSDYALQLWKTELIHCHCRTAFHMNVFLFLFVLGYHSLYGEMNFQKKFKRKMQGPTLRNLKTYVCQN